MWEKTKGGMAMLKLKERVRSIFVDPRKELVKIMPELNQLRGALENAVLGGDPLNRIVEFFDAVSKWHDRGLNDVIEVFEEVNYGQYDGVLENLRTLQLHFVRAGRNECGWNRTKYGETVTSDKVFLGDICGLFTHPVSFWATRKDEEKGGWGFFSMLNSSLNPYDVVSIQAQDFIVSHAPYMIDAINALVATV